MKRIRTILAVLCCFALIMNVSAFAADAAAEKNGEVFILVTSDVHCGIDQGFGYAGLAQIRDALENQGYETILVDDGDAVQGEPIGNLSEGEAIVALMNEIGYDVAIPGNHEFDYGTDRFLELAEMAEYPYICCNFTYLGEPVFAPYTIKEAAGLDIAFVNGGSVRTDIEKGDVTFGDIIRVHPFGTTICVVEATGRQILDALEWGARTVPGETGGFLQVSGLSYEIHVGTESSCTEDANGMFTGADGEYRVQNVMVGDEPLDPEKTYSLAGQDYILLKNGDGFTMFDGAPVLRDSVNLDNQVLIDYITDALGGVIGDEYADPWGQGRIVIAEGS